MNKKEGIIELTPETIALFTASPMPVLLAVLFYGYKKLDSICKTLRRLEDELHAQKNVLPYDTRPRP